MRLFAGRLTSVSLTLSCSLLVVTLATACSSDGPETVSPSLDPSALAASPQVLNLSNGSVVAQIKSTWLQSQCITVRNGTMANNTVAELQPCGNAYSQNFEFVSTGEIKIGSNYCLDLADGASGTTGSSVVVYTCDGTGSQKWQQTTAGEIKGVNNSLCVSFKGHPDSGTALYLAACKGFSNETWNTVPTSSQSPSPAPVANVTLSAGGTTVRVGNTLQVSATIKDSLGNVLTGRSISWTSSNNGVATVSASGLVTGVAGNGNVNITATSEGKSGYIAISVTSVPVATVKVTLAGTSLTVGQTGQAQPTLLDSAGNVLTGRTVTWSSSVSTMASVTAAGLVTALAAGTTNIVATSEGKTGSAALTVTAIPQGGGSCSLVTGTAAHAESAFAKPGYLRPVIEPDFGTTIIRISGDPGTPIGNGIAGNWPSVVYHNYPKDPVFSADQKLIVLKHGFPNSQALFLDGTTYQPLFFRNGPANGGGEWRFHQTLPDVVIALGTNGSVSHWNVRTNVTTTKIAANAGYTNNQFGPFEGNASYDGHYLVAKATRTSDNHTVARVMNVDDGTLGAVIDLTATGVFPSLDWVSVSALGGYVVAYDGSSHRTRVWSRATGAQVQDWTDNPFGHYDLGVDAAGNEVAFGAPSSGTYAHRYLARRLDTGAITDLTGSVTSYNWHAGTRGPTGWGFAATNDRTGSPTDGEIYAVKLDGSKTIQRLAHHRASNASYDRSAFPTASPDGKRIVFASDWEQGSGPLQAYVIDLRPLCP